MVKPTYNFLTTLIFKMGFSRLKTTERRLIIENVNSSFETKAM